MRVADDWFDGSSQGAKFRYLKAISHPRRRRVLDILQLERQSMRLRELTSKILDAAGSPDEGKAEEVRITLYHQHLPQLKEVGLVDVDEQDNSVEITEKALRKLR